MATPASVESLHKVRTAIQTIQKELNKLKTNEEDADRAAEAQAATALALGTLRFLRLRLQGQPMDETLRNELQRMRQLLVRVQAKANKNRQAKAAKEERRDASSSTTLTSSSPKAAATTPKRDRSPQRKHHKN